MTIQTAVMGVTGYAGAELARLLVHHPQLVAKTPVFVGRVEQGKSTPIAEIHPHLAGSALRDAKQEAFRWELLAERGVEVLFLATPHELSREVVPEALKRGIKVIDLSGAWRLVEDKNRAVYKFEDEGTAATIETQAVSVYGMPELHREAIRTAKLIANPGCYATSVILALKPLIAAGLVDVEHGIISDSKSGVSGAGKAPTAKTHYMAASDNLSAYRLWGHRHTGELLEQLGVESGKMIFTPHLLPIPRGILSTIYLRFKSAQTKDAITESYRSFYAESPMVRLYTRELPQIQYSVNTNYCDIGFQIAPDGERCIVVSCLDNLLKGAAGQAVQNLNVLMGWKESEGLE
jgi:N-acetyl-gamma-glutamyl-phosphate reductase